MINWLTGLVLGLATAACIVFLSSRVFPELEDFGVDLGMRVDGGKRSRYAATPRLFEAKVTAGDADRTAWAVWLFKSGDPAWRLQSLSMLQSARSTVWFAGYFLDSVLLDQGAELIGPESGSE